MPKLGKLACVLAVLLPLSLLWDPEARFTYDWHNHEWMVGYFGEYFRQHLRMPEVLNAPSAIGMPQPIFYGFLLYPLLGIGSAVIGASLAIRIGALVVVAVEFASVYVAARRTMVDRVASFVLAAAVTWSTYSLTNLYNRAALTEFFGVGLLTAAVAVAIGALSGRRHSVPMLWIAGTLFVLAVGSHPPTALVGACFVGLLAIVFLASPWSQRDDRAALLRTFAIVSVLGLVVMSPWIYANLQFDHDLGIAGKYRRIFVDSGRADSLWSRVAPFPYDPFSVIRGNAATPYMEAPIDWAILLILGWNILLLVRRNGSRSPVGEPSLVGAKVVMVAAVGWFVLTAAVSVSQPVADLFRPAGGFIQFATRLVSHANLALLVAVLASGTLIVARGGYERARTGTSVVLAASVVIAFLGILIKLTHGAVSMERTKSPQYAWRGDRSALVSGARADAAGDYATVRWRPQLVHPVFNAAQSVHFEPSAVGGDFGGTSPTVVESVHPGWVVTNVVVFPWSRILADGREVEPSVLVANYCRVALELPAGRHTLIWSWQPPLIWRALRLASFVGLAVMLGLAVTGAVRALPRRTS